MPVVLDDCLQEKNGELIIAIDDITGDRLLGVVVNVLGGAAIWAEVVPVVGAERVGDVLAGAVGVDVIGHVVGLLKHVLAHLVEGGCGDEVALAVDVPGDGAVRGADCVVAGGAGGGAGVGGDFLTHDGVEGAGTVVGYDHTAEEVGVVVGLVVDDGEDLRLDADLAGEANGVGGVTDLAEAVLALAGVGLLAEAAEDTVVEGELVLPLGVAGTHLGVGPVDLVGLADLHLLAVLEIVVSLLGGGEAGVLVMLAPASEVVGAAGEELAAGGGLTSVVLGRRGAVVIVVVGDVVLADGKVLRAEVPGDKGVVVLPQFFYFYLFSEGPHGARLPSFSSQSPVKRVDLNTPLGFVRPTSKVKFSRLGEST